MTPLPPTFPTTIAAYNHLLCLLHPLTSSFSRLEIDILPSTHGSTLQYSAHPAPPSLGIPNSLLIPLYLHAHRIFFSYIHRSHDAVLSEGDGKAALDATALLLLWDPNHVTAINFRKRWLIGLSSTNEELFRWGVKREMWFLESLVTSPLPKHTKSSTLWTHRLWLLSPALECVLRLGRGNDGEESDTEEGKREVEAGYWDAELEAVMKAGERHPRNFYAWLYARGLLRELGREKSRGEDEAGDTIRWLTKGCLGKVHRWCLQHPKDISGWAFLWFLLRETAGEKVRKPGKQGDGGQSEARRVIGETSEFGRKYDWRGESISWFLKSAEDVPVG